MFKFFYAVILFCVIYFDSIIFNSIVIYTTIVFLISGLIAGIIYSSKKFVCYKCGHNFKPKWYWLAWSFPSWILPRRFREIKELETGKYKKMWVKCPECKSWECGVEKKVKGVKKG